VKPVAGGATANEIAVATYYQTLQHNAAHYNRLQCNTHGKSAEIAFVAVAIHCNTLQHTATHCNTLQRTATQCNTPVEPAEMAAAIHCNTLQQTTAH